MMTTVPDPIKDHLDKLLKREAELQYAANAHAVSGLPVSEEIEKEYADLQKQISATRKLLKRDKKS